MSYFISPIYSTALIHKPVAKLSNTSNMLIHLQLLTLYADMLLSAANIITVSVLIVSDNFKLVEISDVKKGRFLRIKLRLVLFSRTTVHRTMFTILTITGYTASNYAYKRFLAVGRTYAANWYSWLMSVSPVARCLCSLSMIMIKKLNESFVVTTPE